MLVFEVFLIILLARQLTCFMDNDRIVITSRITWSVKSNSSSPLRVFNIYGRNFKNLGYINEVRKSKPISLLSTFEKYGFEFLIQDSNNNTLFSVKQPHYLFEKEVFLYENDKMIGRINILLPPFSDIVEMNFHGNHYGSFFKQKIGDKMVIKNDKNVVRSILIFDKRKISLGFHDIIIYFSSKMQPDEKALSIACALLLEYDMFTLRLEKKEALPLSTP
jgi:hypothetical protein